MSILLSLSWNPSTTISRGSASVIASLSGTKRLSSSSVANFICCVNNLKPAWRCCCSLKQWIFLSSLLSIADLKAHTLNDLRIIYAWKVSDFQHLSLNELLLFHVVRRISVHILPWMVCSSLHPVLECTYYNLQGSE